MSWDMVKLGDVCEVNPSTKGMIASLDMNILFFFLPMEAMEVGTGIMNPFDKKLVDIKKGYTYFENGDVLFAKITPCMQNGKHAIARDLTNGIGFGSTEFHVLRPKKCILADWVYHFVNQSSFLFDAENNFKGSVGQQRLPDTFLKDAKIPLPPLAEQRRIAVEIECQLNIVEKAKQAATEQLAAARKLNAAYLREVFERNEWEWVRLGTIGDVCMCKRIFKDQTTPKGDIPFYKIGTFGKTADAYISQDIYDKYKSQFPFPKKGNVLISAAGTLGRAVIYDGEPAYFQDSNIVWIDNDEKKALNRYLYHVYATQPWIGIDGAIIARLYNENVREAIIPLPPFDEQQRIVEYLDDHYAKTNRMISVLQAQLDTITAMPAAILQQAFNG
jgi:type I restriction enzyme S subunit